MDQTQPTPCGKCETLGPLGPCDACYYGRPSREPECHDCGSTYHQTGTYHCPAVHQGDSAD